MTIREEFEKAVLAKHLNRCELTLALLSAKWVLGKLAEEARNNDLGVVSYSSIRHLATQLDEKGNREKKS